MQEKVERVHNFAREHIKMMSDKMKQRHDLNFVKEGQKQQQGDAVWLHNPQKKKGLSTKLQRPWQGPYVITKQINDLVYRVQLDPNLKPKAVDRNRLWHYTGENAPTWFEKEQNTQCLPVEYTTTSATTDTTESSEQFMSSEHDTGNESAVQDTSETSDLRRSTRTRRPTQFYGT